MSEELKIIIAAELGQFKQELKAGQDEIKKMLTESEKASKGMDGFTNTVNKQAKQLKELKQKYADAVVQYGEFSDEATGLGQEIAALSSELKDNKAKMEAAKRAADEWDNTIEQVEETVEGFSETVKAQGNELKKLKEKYMNTVMWQGEESDAAKECAAEIERLSQEFKQNRDKLIAAAQAADKFDKSLNDLGDEADDVEEEIDDIGDAMDKTSKKSDGFGKGISGAMKGIGVAISGAVAAVAALGTAMLGVAESTREYRTAQEKLNAAFEAQGKSAEEAGQAYNGLYRFLGDSDVAVEAANHIAQLNLTQEENKELTSALQGVYATYGDSLPIEGLTEAINHTAKLGEVQGPLADALEWAGVSAEEFNAQLANCSTEAERTALINDFLVATYGEAGAAYEKNAADILKANEAQALLTQGLADIGAACEPIITIFKGGLAEALATVTPHITQIAEGFKMMLGGEEGGAEQLATGIQGLVSSIVEMITNLMPTLLSVGVNIITALLEGIVSALPMLLEALINIIPQLIETILGLIPQLIDAVLGAIPQLIEMIFVVVSAILEELGVILPDIVQKVIEILPEIIDSVLDNIPMLLEAAINFLMAIVKAIPEILPELVNALPDIIDSVLDCLINNFPIILQGAIDLFLALVEAIPAILPDLLYAIGNLIGKLIASLVSRFDELGTKVGDALGGAIKGAVQAVISGAVGIINGFIGAINFAIGIINAIPGVSIKKLSKLDVPKLAEGGIATGDTLAHIGEGGYREAVLPLDRNTEWMDALADKLSSRIGGGNAPIVLEVDGKVFAQTAISTINQNTRQTGHLALIY